MLAGSATRPCHILLVSSRWKTATTCQQQFAQLHHVDLKHRGYMDVGVNASAVSAHVT